VAHSAEGFTAGFPSDPSRPSIIYGDCREGSEGKGREGKGRFDIFTGQKRKEPAGKGEGPSGQVDIQGRKMGSTNA
jgi:hypothetical protein